MLGNIRFGNSHASDRVGLHPIQLPDGSDTSLFNVSAPPPPADFSIDISRWGIPLNSKDCFYLTVLTYAYLAQQPFYGTAPTMRRANMPGFPNTFLTLSGPYEHGGFDTRYMVYGLIMAITYMNDHNDFQANKFTLRIGNQMVGLIWFWRPTAGATHQLPGNSSINSTLGPSTMLIKEGPGNSELSFRTRWAGPHSIPINFNELMMVLINAFADLAPMDNDQPIRGFRYHSSFLPYRARLILVPLRSPALSWFTKKVVLAYLLEISQWYLTHPTSECKEASTDLLIDEIVRGSGEVFYRPNLPDANSRTS